MENINFFEEEEDAESLDSPGGAQVFLSIAWSGGKLGAAYYNSETSHLHLLVDQSESSPEFPVLKLLIKQVMPTCIVASSRLDERVINILLHSGSPLEGTSNNESSSSEKSDFLHLMPSMYFYYEGAKHRLSLLKLPNMPQNLSESERRINLSSLIDFTNINMIRAAGGLLKFLDKKRIGIQLEDNVEVPVLALSLFSLEEIVTVDANTYSALQIFQHECHPSIYKYGTGMKEGLSLFGLFNRCRSVLASKELKRMFLQPTRNLKILQQRQNAVSFLISPQNAETTSTLQDALRHIKNAHRILSHMTTAQASVNDWLALYKTVYNAMLIGDTCRLLPQSINIFKKITATFTPDLFRIASLINKIVDVDESLNQNRFVVKIGVDEELDHRKRTYNGLPDFMTKVAYHELRQLNEDIGECSVIYLPQLGYLLAIPQTERMRTGEDYHIPGLEFVFTSNGIVYYKSSSTAELDSLLGDTQCEITDHETQIMHKLQNVILEMSHVLLDVMTYTAELDCLIAYATVAKEFNYVKPEITNDGTVSIIKGRHPLQEACVTAFVPNDYTSSEHGKIKILTGPNASGKSVYLKQVAVIVFLAHIGSFVPADSARISLVDHIFTRIHTLESVSVNLSTFMIDLNQMAVALRLATSKSLVIIDEFGKGTEAGDGLALLASSLQFWLQQGALCPHVLVSTHFYSLLSVLQDSELIQYLTLEVLQNEGDLVFLYQVIEGQANGSFAHYVAIQVGISEALVKRGLQVSELLRKNERIPPLSSEKAAQKNKMYTSISSEFLKLDLDTANLQEFLQHIIHPTSISHTD